MLAAAYETAIDPATLPDDLPRLQFMLTPTQLAFTECDAAFPILIGPEGEGKTHTAIAAMFRHAKRCEGKLIVPSTGQPRDMMGAIIRDTSVNLRRHTVRSIEKICGNAVEIREFKKVFALKASGITCDLFGMDNQASASRIQGGEYDFIWLEEPAPIIHSGNGGMDVSVWEQGQRRIRGGLTPKRLQVTMNPASNDHWTYRQFIQFPDPELRVFRIKKGENPYLSAEDRARRARAFANRPDLAKRYDEGEFGAVFAGVAVTPDFSERLHVHADHNGHPLFLLPIPGVECIRLWDGGLNPSCVILQITPSGHLHFLDAIIGENMGMRQMIRTRLKKVLARPRYEKCFKWRDIGDPALDTRDQSDSDQRASTVIAEELSQPGRAAYFEKGVTNWETRREGLREMFARNVDGRPMVRVNPRPTEGEPCNVLTMVFGGGYQYPVTPSGIVSRDGPLKNKWCVDDETEILTVDGWQRGTELQAGQAVYGYDLTRGVLQTTTVQSIFRDETTTPMLHYRSQYVDMLTTLNHRCVAGHRSDKGVRLIEAEQLCASDFLLRAAPYVGQRRPWYSNDFVRLCAWIMTEGTYRSGRSGAITIGQSYVVNATYCEDIAQLVRRFNGRYVADRGGLRTWQLSGEIVDAIKTAMPDKIPSAAFIHRLTNIQRRLFLYEAIRGDGTWETECLPSPSLWTRNRDVFIRETTPRIFQKCKAAIDALHMIATLAGFATAVRRKISGRHRINGWSLSLMRMSPWASVQKLERVLTTSPAVWCPHTGTGTWVARRNGLVFITGNSHPGDAISHGIPLLLFPTQAPVGPGNTQAQQLQRERTKGYAVR